MILNDTEWVHVPKGWLRPVGSLDPLGPLSAERHTERPLQGRCIQTVITRRGDQTRITCEQRESQTIAEYRIPLKNIRKKNRVQSCLDFGVVFWIAPARTLYSPPMQSRSCSFSSQTLSACFDLCPVQSQILPVTKP